MASPSDPLPYPRPGAHVSRSVHSTSAPVGPTPGNMVGGAFYNENDPFAAAWLRELIADGLIAPGVVDERDIRDVTPAELARFTQCHFFAGIGIWSLALRQAGWPDDLPIWTGSCPCQPFSAAGKGGGFDDERHLWPAFFHLIEQGDPPVIVGEQVAGKATDAWVDLVQADLEGVGHAFGCVPFPAAGVGAPHIRDRNYWLALGYAARCGSWTGLRDHGPTGERRLIAPDDGGARGLDDDDDDEGSQGHAGHDGAAGGRQEPRRPATEASVSGGVADDSERGCRIGSSTRIHGEGQSGHDAARRGEDVRLAHGPLGGWREERPNARGITIGDQAQGIGAGLGTGRGDMRPGPTNGFWGGADWLFCRDGKWRPVEAGTFPLAPAGTVRNRVGTLRGAGNAINLAQATSFIGAVMDVLEGGGVA